MSSSSEAALASALVALLEDRGWSIQLQAPATAAAASTDPAGAALGSSAAASVLQADPAPTSDAVNATTPVALPDPDRNSAFLQELLVRDDFEVWGHPVLSFDGWLGWSAQEWLQHWFALEESEQPPSVGSRKGLGGRPKSGLGFRV